MVKINEKESGHQEKIEIKELEAMLKKHIDIVKDLRQREKETKKLMDDMVYEIDGLHE